jgi:uncharacterized membrane protein
MASVRVRARVAAPVEEVFKVFTDLEGSPGRVRNIKKIELLTTSGFHLGTRWMETRDVAGREATEQLEVTEYEKDRGYTITCDVKGARFDAHFSFTPIDDATDVAVELDIIPQSFGAMLVAPFGRMLLGTIEQSLEQDLADLRAAAQLRVATA